MSFLNGIVADLRERRLWPVALVLALGLVAVPMLLAKSAPTAPVAPVPNAAALAGTAASAATALPAVSVNATPTHSQLNGHARDPFAQQKLPSTTTTSTTTTTAASGSSNSTATGTTASGGAGTASTPASSAPATGSPPAITPAATPKPALTGLTSTQSYRVTLAITNSAGGLDTLDPLERLSVLPGNAQPRVVELGVLKGGRRVLFVVQPGTVLSGPGTCTPGPIDCEILSLAPGQTEGLSMQSATGVVSVALFAVTAITAEEHPSAAAAQKARRAASAAGRRLLSTSTLAALPLFQYQPSVGAVVDLRNLTVGGS
jgi:hypothetical protein